VVGVDLGWDTTFAQNFVKGKLIGQGSFGNVFLGIDLHSGQEVAIKVMPKQRGKLTKERTLQKLVKEVNIMARLQECTNVVRLIGCYETHRGHACDGAVQWWRPAEVVR
jgi:serine/threonine protein kinase